jgi:hypothetical protein
MKARDFVRWATGIFTTTPTPGAGATHVPPVPPIAATPFLDGGDIALEVLQAIGYRTVLTSATIVSYNMQDYEFWGHGTLSHLLLRQLAFGASIRLLTTPPPGKPTSAGFKGKYALLSNLQKNGVSVYLNDKLHAKAYIFRDTTNRATTIVGSANLTGPGFGLHTTPLDSLVEMGVVCEGVDNFDSAIGFVEQKIVNDKRTEDFGTWFTRNSAEIAKAGLPL